MQIHFIKNYICIIAFILLRTQLFAQCGCMSSITSGMLSPSTTIQAGTLREGFLLINLLGNYTTGNKEYSSSRIVANSTVREFWNATTSFSASYGLTKRLTGIIGLNYVLEHNIKTYIFNYSNKGWNSAQIGAKYNIWFNPKENSEITIIADFALPLQTVQDTTYLYLQPTTGAFSISPGLFFHKGYNKVEIDLFAFWNSTIWSNNAANYRFGSVHQITLGITKPISKIFSAGLFVNLAYKDRDDLAGRTQINSGYKTIALSPQVLLNSKNLSIGLNFDIPIYKEYFGSQMTKEFSTSFSLHYKIDTN